MTREALCAGFAVVGPSRLYARTYIRFVRTLPLLCQPFSSTKQGQGTHFDEQNGGHSGILREEKEEGQEEGLQCQLGGHCCGDEQYARVSSFGTSLVLNFWLITHWPGRKNEAEKRATRRTMGNCIESLATFSPLVIFLGLFNGMSSSVPSFSHFFIYLLRHFPRQILHEIVLEFSTPETHCWLTWLR